MSGREDGEWEDGESCCVRGKAELSLLLKMFMTLRSRKEKEKENVKRNLTLNEDKPRIDCSSFVQQLNLTEVRTCHQMNTKELTDSVQLSGLEYADPRKINRILLWTDVDINVGKIKYSDGRIKIVQKGIYYVQSQIYFVEYTDDSNDDDTTDDDVVVYIRRDHNGGDNGEDHQGGNSGEVIAESFRARCARETLKEIFVCEYSVYTASQVELDRNDEVFVAVSHPKIVNSDSKLTYFGLYRIT